MQAWHRWQARVDLLLICNDGGCKDNNYYDNNVIGHLLTFVIPMVRSDNARRRIIATGGTPYCRMVASILVRLVGCGEEKKGRGFQSPRL
jgi:hypothetical protein